MKKEIIYCLKLGRKIKNENIKGVALETKIGQKKQYALFVILESQLFKNQ